MKRPLSLQARLLALLMTVVAAVWVASAVAIWFDARHELDELLDGHLGQAAALLVAQQAHSGEDADSQIDEAEHEPVGRYDRRVAFQVWHEGVLAMRSSNAPRAPMSNQPQGFETLTVDGESWRVFAARGAEHDVQVYVAEREDSRRAILRALLRGSLWPLLVAVPLLALAGWWAVRRGLAPLQHLSERLAQRKPHALEAVGFSDAPAEMRPLVDALDGLFERIATLLESERRFTADAAHELRTPVAAIRTQAQVALGADNNDERRHALLHTLQGCDRASRLIEQLLVLARLEAAPSVAPQARTDLVRLGQRVVADLAGSALAKRQTVELDAPDSCEVAGDEALLAILLRNLVDNAIRYSPERATVRVALARDDTKTVLVVEDSGPGLAEADRARLGERFFRVLGSGERGSGLGWSIVQRIARTQGATLSSAPSSALGGLRVQVVWPV